MSFSNFQAVLLAAGKSARFNTKKTKLCHAICGQELIAYPAKLFSSMHIPTVCIVGHQKEDIVATLACHDIPNITYVDQFEPKGTGHALICALPHLSAEHIIVMNGDVPLVTKELLNSLLEKHTKENAAASFIIAHSFSPSSSGYGRVVRRGELIEIIETKYNPEAAPDSNFVNAGIYVFKRAFLEEVLTQLAPDPHTSEIYITDLIGAANNQGKRVCTTTAPFDTIRGVNTLKDLWAVEHIKRSELITHWMNQGVRFIAAQNVYLDLNVTIENDTVIWPGCILTGNTHIGHGCSIGAYSCITDSTVHDGALIQPHSVIINSIVHQSAEVGPFAKLRSSSVGERAIVGNFVEMNRSSAGARTKAKHLTYLGDTCIGMQANIGAGTITCNFDGVSKHKTIIKDRAMIGSNNALIAPITIGRGAVTGAGSVLTKDVPNDAFSVSRSPQITRDNYSKTLRHNTLAKTYINKPEVEPTA